MSKYTPSKPRINPNLAREPFLPPRVALPVATAKARFATYYLSCTSRLFKPYVELAERHYQRGFRGAILAPTGLVFDSPEMLVGYQLGDTFHHALDWVHSNPLAELAQQPRADGNLKAQAKAQKRFQDAVATVEGVELARRDAEKELDAATAEIIAIQGPEVVVIDGVYYDPSYSHEKVYLRRRHPAFTPSAEVDESSEPTKAGKKIKRRVS